MTATIEDVKKFWDDRPCNVKHSSKEVGTKEYFNEVTKKKFFVENHILNFTKLAHKLYKLNISTNQIYLENLMSKNTL